MKKTAIILCLLYSLFGYGQNMSVTAGVSLPLFDLGGKQEGNGGYGPFDLDHQGFSYSVGVWYYIPKYKVGIIFSATNASDRWTENDWREPRNKSVRNQIIELVVVRDFALNDRLYVSAGAGIFNHRYELLNTELLIGGGYKWGRLSFEVLHRVTHTDRLDDYIGTAVRGNKMDVWASAGIRYDIGGGDRSMKCPKSVL